jgi:hypothetical protein
VCDTDDDNDGIPDTVEGDGDPDEDEIPNWFDTDSDGDGFFDSEEAGDDPSNPVDTDGDDAPDYLDDDSDDDTILDDIDNCRLISNLDQANNDKDDYGNACDNCWEVSNPDQLDLDDDCPDPPYTTDPECGDSCEDTDTDGDGVMDSLDNCPDTPNGSLLGTCVSCNDGIIGLTCTEDLQCTDGYCSKAQEDYDGDEVGDVCDADITADNHPPGGNGCIDACECEGDFEPDGDVDGTDAVNFKTDFFRKDCAAPTPCKGDFECDGDVDGTDAVKFKVDFFRKDCPSCTFNCY